MGKNDNCFKCTRSSCELCSCINAKPENLESHGARLLTVRIRINNVCPDKKVAVACVLYDECHRIVAFKGFITMVCESRESSKSSCGTIERKIVFVIPDGDECDPIKLKARTISNYIYPCESDR